MIVLCLSDTEAGDSCNSIEGNVNISPSLTGGAILLMYHSKGQEMDYKM